MNFLFKNLYNQNGWSDFENFFTTLYAKYLALFL